MASQWDEGNISGCNNITDLKYVHQSELAFLGYYDHHHHPTPRSASVGRHYTSTMGARSRQVEETLEATCLRWAVGT